MCIKMGRRGTDMQTVHLHLIITYKCESLSLELETNKQQQKLLSVAQAFR